MLLATGGDPLEYLWAWGAVSILVAALRPVKILWVCLGIATALRFTEWQGWSDHERSIIQSKADAVCDFECGTRPQHENNPCASLPTKTVTLGEWLNLSKPWLSFSLLPGERVTTQSVLRNSVSRSCVMFTTVSAQTHSESLLLLTIACFSKGTTEAKRFLTGKTKLSWFYSPSSHVSWLPRLCGLFGSFNYFIFSLNTVTHWLVTEALSTLCDIAMN